MYRGGRRRRASWSKLFSPCKAVPLNSTVPSIQEPTSSSRLGGARGWCDGWAEMTVARDKKGPSVWVNTYINTTGGSRLKSNIWFDR
eukprot:1153354-Pelagomonas_calceolata.AAC.1